MSHEREPRPLPPMDRRVTRTEDMPISTPVREYSVYSWCPDDEAKVPPTQVHLLFDMGTPARLAVRFKSRAAVDELIAALERHRDDVWPDPAPIHRCSFDDDALQEASELGFVTREYVTHYVPSALAVELLARRRKADRA